jgi:hypothetical protein
VDKLCFLGDMLGKAGGAEEASGTRVKRASMGQIPRTGADFDYARDFPEVERKTI